MLAGTVCLLESMKTDIRQFIRLSATDCELCLQEECNIKENFRVYLL